MINKYDRQNPGKIELFENNIPQELKKINQWCCWKWSWIENKKAPEKSKWSKPPCDINGNTGNHKEFNYSYKQVVKAYKKNKNIAGIGLSMRETDSIAGVDIDDCICKKGNILKEAQKIVSKCKSYTEISPSGQGIRIFGTGTPKLLGAKRGTNIEVYKDGRYLTVTGNVYQNITELRDFTKQINKITKKYRKKSKNSNAVFAKSDSSIKITHAISKLSFIDPDLHRDDWYKLCFGIYEEFKGSEIGLNIFIRWSRGDFWRNNFRSEKFDEEACINLWNSSNRSKKENIRTGKTIDYYYKLYRPGIIELKTPEREKEIINKFPENPYKGVCDFGAMLFDAFRDNSAQPIKEFIYMSVEATLQYFAEDYIKTPMKNRTVSVPMLGAGLSGAGKDLNTSTILKHFKKELTDYTSKKGLVGHLNTLEYLGEKPGGHTSATSFLQKFSTGDLKFWLDTEASNIIKVLADTDSPHGGHGLTLCLNELYDGHSIAGKNKVKTTIKTINNPFLPILWLTQIDTFSNLINYDLLDVGFLGRLDFFFDLEHRKEISTFSKEFKDKPFDKKVLKESLSFLNWRNTQKKVITKFGDKAQSMMEEFEKEKMLNMKRNQNLDKFLKRVTMSAEKRLTMYSLFNRNKEITPEMIQNYEPLLKYQLEARCHIYDKEINGNDIYSDIKDTIDKCLPKMPRKLREKGFVKWHNFNQAFRNNFRNKYPELMVASKFWNEIRALQFSGNIMVEEVRGYTGKCIKDLI